MRICRLVYLFNRNLLYLAVDPEYSTQRVVEWYQRKTETKSNEITAIPELLRVLDLRGATITIDAMGCQTKIATTIIEGGGDYLLAVRDNQPTLLDDIATLLTEAADERRRSVDELPRPIFEVFQDTDGGHGRVETRTLTLSRDLAWLTASERWSGLDFVAKMVRERTVLSTGKTSTETSYYIGSGPGLSAAAAATTIRRHWSIENSLHWVLDMAFREDEARHRVRIERSRCAAAVTRGSLPKMRLRS